MSVKQTMETVTRFALTHLAAIPAHVEKASVLSLQMQALVKVCKNDFWLVFTLFFLSDIDECVETDHGCSQVCTNTPGLFYCNCQRGFQRVGTTECEGICTVSTADI